MNRANACKPNVKIIGIPVNAWNTWNACNIKFTQRGVIQAFIFTNILVVFVGIINYFLKSNYMFLCAPPDVNNPFLIGEWPYYLLILELIFFIYGYVLLAPFLIIKYLNKNKWDSIFMYEQNYYNTAKKKYKHSEKKEMGIAIIFYS